MKKKFKNCVLLTIYNSENLLVGFGASSSHVITSLHKKVIHKIDYDPQMTTLETLQLIGFDDFHFIFSTHRSICF
jgi:hypothetical protein